MDFFSCSFSIVFNSSTCRSTTNGAWELSTKMLKERWSLEIRGRGLAFTTRKIEDSDGPFEAVSSELPPLMSILTFNAAFIQPPLVCVNLGGSCGKAAAVLLCSAAAGLEINCVSHDPLFSKKKASTLLFSSLLVRPLVFNFSHIFCWTESSSK
ncbi:unnamed protein product [Trifolium pratense]|uniref:Uncharacterized protein n=1 Tax=Trifolium pratense TaxID=57577 RepID=A0ACB0JUQ0_TRIPR|nr:unnamed protein product [Trifolium pratense]